MIDSLVRLTGAEGALAQALAIVFITVVTVISGWIIQTVIIAGALRLTRHTRTNLDDKIVAAARPFIIRLVYLGGAHLLNQYLDGKNEVYSPSHAALVGHILFALLVLAVTLFLLRFVRVLTDWYGELTASRSESALAEELLPLVRRLGQIIVLIVGVMTLLEHFSVDIKALVTVLGVGSLAIGLAAQETISNMIAGFVIMVDRPFRVGDRIVLRDNIKCDVYKIGVRSTKFLTFDNTIIIVPNAELVKMTINNQSYPDDSIRVQVDVAVSYDSDVTTVKKILVETAKAHPLTLAHPAPDAILASLGESALQFQLFCRVAEVKDQAPTALALREEVLRRFRAEGIEIPFPQRTIHVRQKQVDQA